jgi:hypothetical protein
MSSNNKTSVLVKSQLPGFVRDEHGLFVEFLEYYYKFLERDGNMLYVSKNFPKYLDIDEIKADIDHDLLIGEEHYLEEENDYHAFLQKMYDNYASLIPDTILADKVLFLKHAKDFYRARGSERSIQFLMRAFFGEEVQFYYPKNDILRASDGKWFIERSLNVKDFAVNNVANDAAYSIFKSKTIRGATSNSTCDVESVDQYYDNGTLVTELKVSAVEQDFENGEQIYTFFEENGEVKFLSCNLFSGIIISATVTSPGSGYVQGAGVPIISNSGSGGQIFISKVARANLEGKIKAVTVTLPGAGFRANDQLLFTGGGGKNAAANIFSVNPDETFHPANYDIIGSRIIDVANTIICNVADPNEGFAYTNLATIYTNTSNLRVNTIPGSGITEITLSGNMQTSNVYFETGDIIVVANTELIILESNRFGVDLRVSSPGLPGGLTNQSLIIKKKPNSNTIIADSMIYWTYDNCGPIVATAIINQGSGYVELPTVDALSNTFVRSLGILGRMEVIDGGRGYQQGNIIEFINQYGDYGEGANGVVSLVDANGTIQQVAFTTRPGYDEGGAGYSQAYLPRANVITTTGNGANIMVTAIIGDGELLEAQSNVIGTIERLRIVSGGAGYLTNPILDLSTQGDGTAQAFANIVTGIYTYPGRYINDDGHLSGYNFIQDRDYYQPYSYVIRSDVSLEKYRKAIKELAHPSGMILFGQHEYVDKNQENVSANIVNAFITTDSVYKNLIAKFSTSNTFSYTPSSTYTYLTFDKRTGTGNTAANLGNILYNTQNVWYNAANTAQRANVRGNAYFSAAGLEVLGIYANGNATMQHVSTLNVANVITVSVWYNLANNSGIKTIVSKQSGTVRGFDIDTSSGAPYVVVRPGVANNILTITPSLNANTWQHVAFTYDGSKIRGYSNGVFKAISTGTANGITDTTGNLIIGGFAGFQQYNFEGKVASVEIYNKVLSNTEIQTLFNKDRRRFGI